MDMHLDDIVHPRFVRDDCGRDYSDRSHSDHEKSLLHCYQLFLHIEDHSAWNRLDFSRTCHQIFAETATKYFERKLLSLSLQMAGTWDDRESLPEFTNRIPFSQGDYIKGIVLDHR